MSNPDDLAKHPRPSSFYRADGRSLKRGVVSSLELHSQTKQNPPPRDHIKTKPAWIWPFLVAVEGLLFSLCGPYNRQTWQHQPRSFSLTQPYKGISMGKSPTLGVRLLGLSPIPPPSSWKLRPQDVCGGVESRSFLAAGQKSWTPTPTCQSLTLPLVAPWPQTAPNRPHPHIPSR